MSYFPVQPVYPSPRKVKKSELEACFPNVAAREAFLKMTGYEVEDDIAFPAGFEFPSFKAEEWSKCIKALQVQGFKIIKA